MVLLPELPNELWNIIFTFKEKIELRDECTISDNPKELRSGKLVYDSKSRMNRFMNKISFIIHSVDVDNHTLKVKKITDAIFDDYYFINENIDIILKYRKSFNKLMGATIDKIYQFRNILSRSLVNNDLLDGMMSVNEINYSLFIVTKCIYFLDNYECIKNIKDCRCNDDPHDRWDGIEPFKCKDFTQYCH